MGRKGGSLDDFRSLMAVADEIFSALERNKHVIQSLSGGSKDDYDVNDSGLPYRVQRDDSGLELTILEQGDKVDEIGFKAGDGELTIFVNDEDFTVELAGDVDLDRVQTDTNNGVITVFVPRKEDE